MPKLIPIARELSRARWLPPLVVLLTLAVLGVTIWLDTARLRDEVRSQLIEHDGEVLLAVARAEQVNGDFASERSEGLENSAAQMALALKLSKLKEGVLGVRLFDAHGRSVLAMPDSLRGADLSAEELSRLSDLRPVSRYKPAARLDELFLVGAEASRSGGHRVPLHLVLIPILAPGRTNLLTAAQLILDGHDLAREFTRLDRKLLQRAFTGFLLTGGILVAALTWGFGYLQKINRHLQDQAVRLRRANQELALAAKTSALGAVTAHLVHGLTSPLSGLHQFVSARAATDAESQDALLSAQRMQALIDETVRVLSDANGATAYELPPVELVEVLDRKIMPLAEAADVRYASRVQAGGVLANRDANLVALILENLLRNAVQATPRGHAVRLDLAQKNGALVCEVSDEGPGLPEPMRQNLFMPCRSTKPGGTGIGLVISQQLARHLGARLDLISSGAEGCVFALTLPAALLVNGETQPNQFVGGDGRD